MKQILTWFVIALLIGACKPSEPPPEPPPSKSIVTLGNPTSPKKALVIGNSQYKHKPLENPQNDATDMANLLAEEMDFHVIRALNLESREMKKVISDFHKLVANTPDVEEKVGLFYFSGHGARSNRNKNYLLPIDNGTIRSDYDLRKKAFQVNGEIVKPLEADNNGANIIIADACRDNPYEGSTRTGNRGLIPISPPSSPPQKGGTVIAFAASEGEVADDGPQRNGLYTKHLLAKMKELKNDSIERVFKQVVEPVVEESKGSQNPEYRSSLTKKYCLRACLKNPKINHL
ncbi:MAG: hypothetical protein DRR19_15950 [Candidatus Parabeggiatoa sp. nov. 1]|nr:MAG: hypothetical protein DRR19_15950 [Gammaproteobacteria bacterium]